MAAQAPDVALMPRADAKRLTAQIRRQLGDVQSRSERLAEMVRTAYREAAWAALGYGSWDEWLRAEFPDLTRGQKYRLVAWGEVVGELEAATGGPVEVSGRQAAEAKRRGPSKVAGRVRERLAGKENPTAEERRAALASALSDPIEATAAEVVEPPSPVEEPRPAAPTEPGQPSARTNLTTPTNVTITGTNRPADVFREPHMTATGTSAVALLAALLAVDPADATDVEPVDLDRLQSWTGLVRAAIRRRSTPAPAAARPSAAEAAPAAKAAPTSAPAPRREEREVSPSECRHPENRRLGPLCAVCGAQAG